MSNLVDHARRELELAGLFGKDADYDGALASAVLELIEKFAAQGGHSGGSAHQVVRLFGLLALFQPLTPITSRPEEWIEVTSAVGGSGRTWQNVRHHASFSNDGGKSCYSVDDPKREVRLLSPPKGGIVT